MIRDYEGFDLRGEFAPRDERLDFDIVRPSEPISTGAIYSSPGGAVYEDFSPPQPYWLPMAPSPVSIPPGPPARMVTTMIPGAPGYDEYMARLKQMREIAGPLLERKQPGEMNIIDKFFDWLNKILS